jgi:hypothetical protein
MLLIRLRTAKKGCVPSYAYLKKKLKIKDDRTITRALDRLQLFGYITWKNRGQNKTNQYYFREDFEEFQTVLQNNLRLRRLMSQKQKNIYNQRLRDNFVNKQGIKVINN